MGEETPKGETSPLPYTDISLILGLTELLKSKGGRDDIYKLAGELNMEFGETLNVIRAAELLNLVNTPGGDVELVDLGRKITSAKVNEKKDIICEQIEKIPVIDKVVNFLKHKDEAESSRDDLVEFLAEILPNENAETTFDSVVNWGRYAELFGYNDDTHVIYLDDEASQPAEKPEDSE